jgi:hypothetical protein
VLRLALVLCENEQTGHACKSRFVLLLVSCARANEFDDLTEREKTGEHACYMLCYARRFLTVAWTV